MLKSSNKKHSNEKKKLRDQKHQNEIIKNKKLRKLNFD